VLLLVARAELGSRVLKAVNRLGPVQPVAAATKLQLVHRQTDKEMQPRKFKHRTGLRLAKVIDGTGWTNLGGDSRLITVA
jgi:hypothetical protein